MSEKEKIELFPCDSGLGSSFDGWDTTSNYEYDFQRIPLTLCNLRFGLQDRLERQEIRLAGRGAAALRRRDAPEARPLAAARQAHRRRA